MKVEGPIDILASILDGASFVDSAASVTGASLELSSVWPVGPYIIDCGVTAADVY